MSPICSPPHVRPYQAHGGKPRRHFGTQPPDVRNALSPELIESLIEEFRAVERAPLVKCIIIRGEGEHFSAGGDVKKFNDTLALSPEERFSIYERKLLYGVRLPNLLLQARKPVIVQTRGAVAGLAWRCGRRSGRGHGGQQGTDQPRRLPRLRRATRG
ncbi:enoyl-CoA hydratase/isomerase family protein [Pseudomonas sp. BR20]|uniref:enoyl-CoA hydratase/isomerase family protein n=1 Tax=Pseudomonas sp. BR20 TaxID=3137452 RepID=UPI003D6E710D